VVRAQPRLPNAPGAPIQGLGLFTAPLTADAAGQAGQAVRDGPRVAPIDALVVAQCAALKRFSLGEIALRLQNAGEHRCGACSQATFRSLKRFGGRQCLARKVCRFRFAQGAQHADNSALRRKRLRAALAPTGDPDGQGAAQQRLGLVWRASLDKDLPDVEQIVCENDMIRGIPCLADRLR